MFAVLAPNKDTKIPLRGVELPITEPDLHYPYTYTGKQLAVVLGGDYLSNYIRNIDTPLPYQQAETLSVSVRRPDCLLLTTRLQPMNQ